MTDLHVDVFVAGPNDQKEWDGFVHSSDSGEVYHLYAWRRFFETVFGHQCHYLIARGRQGNPVGVLPLVHIKNRLFGNFLLSVPCFNYCGVLAQDSNGFNALISEARKLSEKVGAAHVELRHRDHVQSELPARHDKVCFRLPLPSNEEALWESFSSKLRSQIRRPGKAGAGCLRGGVELLDQFYNVFSRNMRDLGTPVYPRRFFREILSRFPEQATIFVVELAGTAVAASLTIGFRDTLEVPFASAIRDYNRVAPNMLLYWSMMQQAIESQYRVFDFGRCTANSGPYRFKKQWGARAEGLAWHYIQDKSGPLPQINPDNPKYRLAVNLWRRLPVSVANYLGPQLVKKIP